MSRRRRKLPSHLDGGTELPVGVQAPTIIGPTRISSRESATPTLLSPSFAASINVTKKGRGRPKKGQLRQPSFTPAKKQRPAKKLTKHVYANMDASFEKAAEYILQNVSGSMSKKELYAHCGREYDVNPDTLKTRLYRNNYTSVTKTGHAHLRLLGDAEDALVALWRIGARTGLPHTKYQVISAAKAAAADLQTHLPVAMQSHNLQKWNADSDMRNWFDNMMKRESKSSAGALKLKPPRGISSGRKACATEGAISAFKNNIVDQLLKDEDHKGIRLSDVGNWDEWHCDRMAMLLRGSVMGETGDMSYQVTDGEKDQHISALTLFVGGWIAPMMFIFSAEGAPQRNWSKGAC